MTNDYLKLEDKIRQVRRRMKWIGFVKGLAISLGLTVAILLFAGYAADHWNYSASALRLSRIGSLVAILVVFGWFLLRPLLRRVPDATLARYIEERHPEIQDRLVSAIELGQKQGERNPLLPLLYKDAFNQIRPIEPRTLFNPREPLLSGVVASCLVGCFALLQLFGPDFLHYATLKLYADWLYPQPKSIYSIQVVPGDTHLRKGSDQLISARLVGFDSPEVNFFSRYESSGKWEKSRMEPEKKSSSFGFLFLDLNENVHYYVQAGKVRSREFAINVKDVPQVERVNLVYHYPQYTGLPDRREEDSGDIAALQGTRVEVEVETNVPAQAAKLSLADGTSVPLQRTGEQALRGMLTVTKNSSYKVLVSDFDNQAGLESIEYSITALQDQPPQVSMTRPGRDTQVTKLEEVLTEAKADDDFGLRSLELHFNVNGGPDKVVNLFKGRGDSTKAMSGTHTFFLEEYDLQPGDVVSYFARATDARNKSDSDIYFLEVRPFGKEYSQSQTSGMQGGGGGQTDTMLSRRQKEILAATFRLIRDRKTFGNKEYSENLKVVADSQQKLQREAKSLSDRMIRRALTEHDDDFQKLTENLQKAVDAMTPAHRYLSEEKPNQAMSPEQTALQHLMRAESFFRDIQVAHGNSSGAGNQSEAQDLENLFELELDQLKNQYETLQQQKDRKADAELDNARDRLKELAQRQQQMNERQRQAAPSQYSQGGGSPRSDQLRLQEEVQKLARQLERLSREKQNEELAQAGRRLQQAAQDLQNSSQGANNSGENQGTRALNRMNEARRLMDKFREGSLSNEVKRLQEQASELGRQQEQIRSDLERLTKTEKGSETGSDANRGDENPRDVARRIQSTKNDLKRGLGELQQGLDEAARKAAGQQKNGGSRDLRSAANYLREEGLPQRIDQGREMIMRGLVDNAKQREQSIQESLGELNQRMASAERGLQGGGNPDSPQDRLEEALNKTGDLASDLESLQRRAKEQMSGRRSQNDQQKGQQGQQQGQDGQQQSQEGQQGQAGQQGQQGQQGQRGRAQGGREAGYPGAGQQYAGGPSGGRDAVNFGERAPLAGIPQLTPEQVRQFDKEYQLRYREGQELARQLRDRPELSAQVEDILKRMKGMPAARMLTDENELARLKTSIIEGFRQLELQLSRELNEMSRKDNIRLSKDEDIPKEYRKQVEDYYRALAEKKAE